jgi:hypothetical protein
MTRPFCVDTTCPQPTPQNGHTVVVAVAARVLSGGTAGAQPVCVTAPAATAPLVNAPRNCRRVGSLIEPSPPVALSSHVGRMATRNVTSAVMKLSITP